MWCSETKDSFEKVVKQSLCAMQLVWHLKVMHCANPLMTSPIGEITKFWQKHLKLAAICMAKFKS